MISKHSLSLSLEYVVELFRFGLEVH